MTRTLAVATLVAFGAGFLTGIGIERTGNNPVPGAVPGIGDKPKKGLVVQDGEADCSLYEYGFHKDDGCPVAYGKGFRVGFHTVKDGWTIKGNALTLTVLNDNPGPISGFWHSFHLNLFDQRTVTILDCETSDLLAHESRTVTCKPLSGDEPVVAYDNVWIS